MGHSSVGCEFPPPFSTPPPPPPPPTSKHAYAHFSLWISPLSSTFPISLISLFFQSFPPFASYLFPLSPSLPLFSLPSPFLTLPPLLPLVWHAQPPRLLLSLSFSPSLFISQILDFERADAWYIPRRKVRCCNFAVCKFIRRKTRWILKVYACLSLAGFSLLCHKFINTRNYNIDGFDVI